MVYFHIYLCYNRDDERRCEELDMTVIHNDWAQKLANINNCSRNWIYVLSRKLGRRATQKDLDIAKVYGRGRPSYIDGDRYPNRVKNFKNKK